MNTNRNSYKVLVALIVLIVVSLSCGGGGDGDQVVITPTAINTGDDTANEIIDDTIEVTKDTNEVMGIIARINCQLGFDSCNESVESLGDVITPE